MKLTEFKSLVEEFHPKKNGELKPEDLHAGSHQRVWWQCAKHANHVWQSEVRNRTRKGYGCRFCAGREASSSYNLKLIYPAIAKTWHPTKNGKTKPENVLPNSTKVFWWLCQEGHEYQHSVNQRVTRTRTCPVCSGYRIQASNSFAAKSPEAAKEWDYNKNSMTPDDVAPWSHKKYWFICKRAHSFKARLSDRSKGSGCPKCTNNSSQPELRILAELESVFADVIHRKKFGKTEIDVFIPSLNVGIEYDGAFWHGSKDAEDKEKNMVFKKKKIDLIRVREKPLNKISEIDLNVEKGNLEKKDIDKVLKKICELRPEVKELHLFRDYFCESDFKNDKRFRDYQSYSPLPHPSKALTATHPELIDIWDFEKNDPLTPADFTHGSNKKVFWVCSLGHSYQQTVYQKTGQNAGCVVCNKNRLRKGIKRKSRTTRDPNQLRLL